MTPLALNIWLLDEGALLKQDPNTVDVFLTSSALMSTGQKCMHNGPDSFAAAFLLRPSRTCLLL